MAIHERALVHPSVDIDPSNDVGPGAVIEEGVQLGKRNRILANAYVCTGTTLGDDNQIHMSTVIGHEPQDLAFSGEPTFLRIGNRNIFREHVSVHRGTAPGSATEIGDDCYLMATSHVAHNCRVGNHVILVNGALLAGHVTVDDGAFLSGHAVVHQFVRVGTLCLMSGLTGINRDAPPYMICSGRPGAMVGVNKVGLRRAGMGPEVREKILDAFKTLYRCGHTTEEAVAILEQDDLPEIQTLVRFIRESKRGIAVAGPGKDEG